MKAVIHLYAILAVIGGIALALSLFAGISPCIIYQAVGIPCPACGMTRAFISAAGLNIQAAFAYHPLFFLVPFLPLAAHEKIPPKRQNFIWLALLAVLIAVWVIRMIRLFPETAPMAFNDNSILGWVIRQIRAG